MSLLTGKKKLNSGESLPEIPRLPQRPIRDVAGDAITTYCQQASDAIMKVNDAVQAEADSFRAESEAIRDNLLKIAELERERTHSFYDTIRDATQTIIGAGKTIRDRYIPSLAPTPVNEAALSDAITEPKDLKND